LYKKILEIDFFFQLPFDIKRFFLIFFHSKGIN